MATISIDGHDLCFDVICGVGETVVTLDVQDFYVAWKDWMLLADNAKFPQAMSSAGGDPIGGGERIGAAFFLNTSLGWKICPVTVESEVRIILSGNLFPDIPGDPLFAYDGVTPGGHTHIEMRTSSLPSIIETGVSGLTPEESNLLAQSADLLNEPVEGSMTLAQALRVILAVLSGKSSVIGSTVTFRDLADTKDRVVATVSSGSRTSITVDAT